MKRNKDKSESGNNGQRQKKKDENYFNPEENTE